MTVRDEAMSYFSRKNDSAVTAIPQYSNHVSTRRSISYRELELCASRDLYGLFHVIVTLTYHRVFKSVDVDRHDDNHFVANRTTFSFSFLSGPLLFAHHVPCHLTHPPPSGNVSHAHVPQPPPAHYCNGLHFKRDVKRSHPLYKRPNPHSRTATP